MLTKPDISERPAKFDAGDQPASVAEIQQAFEESLALAKQVVSATSDERALAKWTLTGNGKPIWQTPRIKIWRTLMFNHYYHHRGQLSVYLRALDVKIPAIYGPSADEDPFA